MPYLLKDKLGGLGNPLLLLASPPGRAAFVLGVEHGQPGAGADGVDEVYVGGEVGGEVSLSILYLG